MKIVALLEQLRDQGNTVITIEHDLDIIERADYIIELGLGAGAKGGELVACGTVDEIKKNDKSVIAPYLRNRSYNLHMKQVCVEKTDFIKIIGAQANNLKISMWLFHLTDWFV